MNKNNNFQLKAILTIAFMLCQFSVVSFGQITMFDNSKSELEPQNVAYDSLYNIKKVKSRHPNYDYLIGQRLFLTSSSCHPKIFIKEFGDFLMPCHQHGLGVNLLVQR